MTVSGAVATVLLIAGVAVELVAVVGVTLMRDVLDRLHYVGLVSYGALLVAVSVLVRESFSLIGDKALFTGVFLAVFGPVVVHVTARSMRIRERGDWRPNSGAGDDGDRA